MDPNARPKQLDSPIVGSIVKAGSRLNTRLYRLTGGRLGSRWRFGSAFRQPAPVCLLTTIGRKSGQPRTVPLLYLRSGDDIVVVASQGGMNSNPAWYLNLTANPHVTVQIGADTTDLIARTASDEERTRLWPELVALYRDFDTYAQWTDRTIPVVVCSPR
ncbi:nitroreductase family deazaflavin-dependent oxidoreductase [Gordonia sinesedis]